MAAERLHSHRARDLTPPVYSQLRSSLHLMHQGKLQSRMQLRLQSPRQQSRQRHQGSQPRKRLGRSGLVQRLRKCGGASTSSLERPGY